MEIEFLGDAVDDLHYWRKSGNKAIQKKISQLLADIKDHPFTGIGKPEQLKYNFAGKWSRRIDREHRIVYEIKNDIIYVHSLKGHY